MRMQFYDDQEADKMATQFFKYYYHDRGKMKWAVSCFRNIPPR